MQEAKENGPPTRSEGVKTDTQNDTGGRGRNVLEISRNLIISLTIALLKWRRE